MGGCPEHGVPLVCPLQCDCVVLGATDRVDLGREQGVDEGAEQLVSLVKISGPTVRRGFRPHPLLGLGLKENFSVVAAQQEGEAVQVVA